MMTESKIALDCPCCGEPIYRPASWFRKSFMTCPSCQQGLAAAQFDAMLHDLDEAFDDGIEQMLSDEKPHHGCGCKKGGCR